MYHWKFNSTAGSYALFDGDRQMNLNPPPDCVTDDMKRIARALNMEAAMGEVREAAINLLSNTEYEDGQSTGSTLDCEALEKALAALDRAEGV